MVALFARCYIYQRLTSEGFFKSSRSIAPRSCLYEPSNFDCFCSVATRVELDPLLLQVRAVVHQSGVESLGSIRENVSDALRAAKSPHLY